MIQHRATIFEENSTLWMKRHDIKMAEADNLPRGYRSTWNERHKLAIAKLAGGMSSATRDTDFPSILLKQGGSSDVDEFIEVHVYGPLTIRSFERVTLPVGSTRAKRVIRQSLEADLTKAGIETEVA
jgi:hypothetical protein